ncbi:hypothetical protein HPP92_005061 [Vanilla planifolia]|uniref:Uncharacterized protein n=1 Tax=Vanilla planifolia TaxID=51239 RepID=A0A835RXV4_VANPL|nr:hypothetical protein HPP92_005061 [Vanilla planifolia]
MASRLPPSALLSPSQFRPADSSLCRTFVSPGVRNISAVLIQREQSNNLSPCSWKRQPNGSALRAALGESAVLEPPPSFKNPGPDVVSLKLKLVVMGCRVLFLG